MNLNGLKNIPQLKIFNSSVLLFILLIGVALKFKYIFQDSLWPDEALYLYIARNLATDITNLTDISGHVFYKSPPLLMYVLSLATSIDFITFDQAARIILVLMGTGTLLATFFIGRKLYTPLVGIIAALLLAVCPLTNWNSIRILTDAPVVFLIYLSICMLVHDKKAAFYFFGLCALLTKYTAFPVLLLPLLMKLKPRNWTLLYAVGFVALLLFVLTKNHFPVSDGWISYFYRFFKLPDMIQVGTEVEYFLGYIVVGLSLAGIFLTIREKKFSALFHWVLFFGLCRVFLPWAAFRVSRYTLPLYPGLFLFAAYGCYRSVEMVASKWPAHKQWATLLIIVSMTYVVYNHSTKSVDLLNMTSRTFIGYDKAGAFLMSQQGHRSLATASPRQMKYYAPGFDVYDIAKNVTPEKLREVIKTEKIGYISIDFWSLHLPAWCRNYDFQSNGYALIYGEKNVFVFKVL